MTALLQCEQDIIVNSMLRKSSKEIASILGIDETTVALFIKAFAGKVDFVTKDQQLALKKAKSTKTQSAKQKKPKKQKVITSVRSMHSPVKRQEKTYADRQVKMNELIPVKVDHKTYIYLKPGTDIEKTKQQYLDLMNNNKKIIL